MIIIAEAGVNHNGSVELAKKLVTKAANAKADFVKFQTFVTSNNITKNAAKAEYQKNNSDLKESQFDMIRKLELDRSAHEEIIEHCQVEGIRFLSTAFDREGVELLSELDIPFYKIASGEITNLSFLRQVGSMGKPIVMSTGMATMQEVRNALNILIDSGTKKGNVTVLHCNTEYPTPLEDVNLKAMITMRDELGVEVGYSDHTLGIEIPIAAAALGATIIEKHFTLDRNLPGPDHRASLEPVELEAMVAAIRNIEMAMGDGVKKPSPSEFKNITIARKSLVAATTIRSGEFFTVDNLTVKRPGTGISPMRWDEILGQISPRDFIQDELIEI